jgi:hypothetical protein
MSIGSHLSVTSFDSSWTYDEDNPKIFRNLATTPDLEKGEPPTSIMARGPSVRTGSALPEFTGGYRAVVWKPFKDEKVRYFYSLIAKHFVELILSGYLHGRRT